MLYLERVLSLLSKSPADEAKLAGARARLQALLRESNLYRVQLLLGETSQECVMFKTNLITFSDCAIVGTTNA